jgi:hypothetical protein
MLLKRIRTGVLCATMMMLVWPVNFTLGSKGLPTSAG